MCLLSVAAQTALTETLLWPGSPHLQDSAEPRLGSAVVRRWVLEDLEYDLKLCVVKYNEGSVRHVIRPYCRGQMSRCTCR